MESTYQFGIFDHFLLLPDYNWIYAALLSMKKNNFKRKIIREIIIHSWWELNKRQQPVTRNYKAL